MWRSAFREFARALHARSRNRKRARKARGRRRARARNNKQLLRPLSYGHYHCRCRRRVAGVVAVSTPRRHGSRAPRRVRCRSRRCLAAHCEAPSREMQRHSVAVDKAHGSCLQEQKESAEDTAAGLKPVTSTPNTCQPDTTARQGAKEADTSNANSQYIKPQAHKNIRHEREVSSEREEHNSSRRARYKRGRVVNDDDAKPSPSPLLGYSVLPENESERAVLILIKGPHGQNLRIRTG